MDHQTNDKAKVAATAAPKTRVSNPIIAPKAPLADWLVVLAELVGELEITTVVMTLVADALPVLVVTILPAEADELAVDKGNDTEVELEDAKEAKLGAATAWEGSTS